MTAFHVEINAVDVQAQASPEEGLVAVVITVGMVLPFSTGPDQPPMIAPIGQMSTHLTREQAEKIGSEGAKLPVQPKASSIVTATNMSEVERAAQAMSKVTKR